MGWFVTLKKGPKYGLQIAGSLIFKKARLFATQILDLFLNVPDPKKYQVDLIN